jgi:hypothetical protein
MKDELDALWAANWPATPPVGHLLPDLLRDRWVRFHSLPESKRYPDTEEEYATILARHHELLARLGLNGRCFVLMMLFADEELPPPPADSVPLPRAIHWRTVPPMHGEEMDMPIYASELIHPSEEIDTMIRLVADDEICGLIVVPPDAEWLYHPYDGGVDVIAESPVARDALREHFRDWLSDHPRGL